MKSLVILGVFCAAVVNANHHRFNGGGYYPYYSDGYVVQQRPLLRGPGASVVQHRPLLRGPGGSVVEQRPLLRGPGGSVIFSGTGDIQAAGTGLGFFAGQGQAGFTGDLSAGVIAGRGEAVLNGAGQIQVSTVPGVGVVGNVENFRGEADFQGNGVFAGLGTGVFNAQGTGIGGFVGNDGFVQVNGVGQTTVNAFRGGRNYVPAVPVYNSVHPSYSTYPAQYNHGYSTYGSLYNNGYLPSSYGTYRLSQPAPVAGTTYTPTNTPTYTPTNTPTYTPTYAKSDRTGRLLLCGGLMFPLC